MTPRRFQQIFWAACGAVALTCSFPGIGASFCAWFALALLMVALRDATPKEAVYLGLFAGIIHYLTLLYWLVPTMHRYGPLPWWASAGILLLLAFYLAIYVALFSGFVVKWAARPAWCLVAVPVTWVALEFLRTHLLSGFPWALLGYCQHAFVPLIQISDLFGVYGVSFLLAIGNAAVFLALISVSGSRWQQRPVHFRWAATGLAAAAVLVALSLVYGQFRIADVDDAIADAGAMNTAVIQGNIAQSLKWDEAFCRETIGKYIALSEQAAENDPAPELVVWPETALPFYFFYNESLTDTVLDGIDRIGVPFLIGSPAYEYHRQNGAVDLYNSAYLVDGNAEVLGQYSKVHLVPFGEYVPLQQWLPFVGKMVPQIADFAPGRKGHLLTLPHGDKSIDLGVQICYEIIFPGLSSAMVRQGGDLIVNITNDAWFGRTAGPRQHFSMAVFRSVENRRSLVRAANTGISGFVDPAGRIRDRSRLYTPAALTDAVPVVDDIHTVYTRYGDMLPVGCLAGVLLFLTFRLRNLLSRRRRG
ncbi:MAG: apolipoprotein N-acyltransferase [Thermodesulfobacteriota bacterium]